INMEAPIACTTRAKSRNGKPKPMFSPANNEPTIKIVQPHLVTLVFQVGIALVLIRLLLT
ncbi:hypothetical protein, partial [Lactococcus petauri]|uniref:hypothetical protein n=1 Tax=Lactococcus petauri TaxID=1940789 RepID=UPI00254EF27E